MDGRRPAQGSNPCAVLAKSTRAVRAGMMNFVGVSSNIPVSARILVWHVRCFLSSNSTANVVPVEDPRAYRSMKQVEKPVLIVGGAGCGLSSAIFLARLGIESWLVERYPTTSPAPKAHYLNQRTMEIFREEEIADRIYEVSTPAENMSRVGWYTSL